jgi:hypothetical protein
MLEVVEVLPIILLLLEVLEDKVVVDQLVKPKPLLIVMEPQTRVEEVVDITLLLVEVEVVEKV